MATQVSSPSMPLQTAPGPHCCPFAHEAPLATGVAQVPQSCVPPSAAESPAEQSPLEHCAPVTHAAPDASDPVSKLHGPAFSLWTAQPPDVMADTHASSELGGTPTPGRAIAAVQSVSNRPWMRASSLAGGVTFPLQGPLKIAWK